MKKTKEEILQDFGAGEIPFSEEVTMYYPAILDAMEEYKDQECEELRERMEFIVKNSDRHRFFEVIKKIRRLWIVQIVENKKIKERNNALVTELFCANKIIAELRAELEQAKERIKELEGNLAIINIPDKKENYRFGDDYDDGVVGGWNSCIEEIKRINGIN